MEYNYDIPSELSRFPGVGGGDDYDPDAFCEPDRPCGDRITASDADFTVESASELERAVGDADEGDVIWIPGDVDMDITGVEDLSLPRNGVIASDRGMNGSDGALLYTAESPRPLFKLTEDGGRITSARFLGPIRTHEEYAWYKEGTGVAVDADDIEVDNCVFRGFGHACVAIGRDGFVGGTHVHHNRLVDNPMSELGYGVITFHGNPLIQSNYLDNNRHGIACDGWRDASYTARYNFCGPHTVLQTFDMHRASEVDSNAGDQAGRWFEIVNNVIMAAQETYSDHTATGIYIRGTPLEGGLIANNQFAQVGKPSGIGDWGEAYEVDIIDQSLEDANVIIGDNHYGVDSPKPISTH